MKISAEVLVDLIAADLVSQSKIGLVTVIHEAVRVFGLLEASCGVAYVNLRTPKYTDFRPVSGGLPTPKERISAITHPVVAKSMIERSGLVVMCVPGDAGVAACLPQVVPGKQRWILYGDRRAAGWSRASQLMRDSDVALIEFGTTRMLVSADVVEALGGSRQLLPESTLRHAESVARAHPQRLSIDVSSGTPRMRLIAEPVRWIAAGNDWLTHNLLQEGRALFSTRGLGSLIVPWVDRCTLLLLLRNVRDRVDDLVIATEYEVLRPSRVDYTEHGAVLAINQPALHAWRDAMLHLELPRGAVPSDGFCDIGALSASLELAA